MRYQTWSQLKEFVLQLSKDYSFNSLLIVGTEPRNLKLAAFRIQVWAKWKQFSLPQEVTETVEQWSPGQNAPCAKANFSGLPPSARSRKLPCFGAERDQSGHLV